MKLRDLFGMCLQNLRRRKLRTFLTMLGVVIGCCSIVIMVSIGVGMGETQEKLLSEMGDLTLITVMPKGSGKNAVKIYDGTLQDIRSMKGVVLASPKLESYDYSIQMSTGALDRYVASWGTVVGMTPDAAEKLGYTLKAGRYPAPNASDEVLVGEYFAYSFADTKRPDGYNMIDYWVTDAGGNLPNPYFDPLNAQIKLQIGSAEENGKTASKTFKVVGVLKEDYSKGYETSQGLILDVNAQQNLIKEFNRLSGKKTDQQQTYSTAIVKVDSIDRVASVEGKIQDLGFTTDSMESIRKPIEKDARQKQLIFGGLGAIALLVAALGITNTMIMSITERTREIGIMKALGCYTGNIRSLFLMEAGSIGLLGGLFGVLLSEIISVIMNLVSAKERVHDLASAWEVLGEYGGRMSVIPPWLLLFAVGFSILIGLVSGYYPASKAVRIPALEAIKYE